MSIARASRNIVKGKVRGEKAVKGTGKSGPGFLTKFRVRGSGVCVEKWE